MTIETLLALAGRVASGRGCDNALDVEVEMALFEPDGVLTAIRPNCAGSKVICTQNSGPDLTFRAQDWTMDRERTAASLRARAEAERVNG